MEAILILICFAFPGEPEECAIATLTPTTYGENTTAEVVNAYCTVARRALADNYPDSELMRCEEWEGEPVGSTST